MIIQYMFRGIEINPTVKISVYCRFKKSIMI